jgi:hypothetical protein
MEGIIHRSAEMATILAITTGPVNNPKVVAIPVRCAIVHPSNQQRTQK